MLVANKVDTPRVVSTDEGRQLASQLGALFVETSAKTSLNVEKAFLELVTQGLYVDIDSNDALSADEYETNQQQLESIIIRQRRLCTNAKPLLLLLMLQQQQQQQQQQQ
ncbi:hypothetical protein EAH_00043280 [Eimeria acervulina]|uniref:Ras family domain-containing protein n=1 Tax=Eimeria acervulina TaxID=5801 RepID=U6GU85_EIMAC|nr:hypothetical protein EAH_00043280 [Eimeria acervulina]CDI83735.1 hypothetical protein EAH_00043280 [Eimeria acervulina]